MLRFSSGKSLQNREEASLEMRMKVQRHRTRPVPGRKSSSESATGGWTCASASSQAGAEILLSAQIAQHMPQEEMQQMCWAATQRLAHAQLVTASKLCCTVHEIYVYWRLHVSQASDSGASWMQTKTSTVEIVRGRRVPGFGGGSGKQDQSYRLPNAKV